VADTVVDARLRIVERQEKLIKRKKDESLIEQVNGRLPHGGTYLTAPPGPEGLPWIAYGFFAGAFTLIIALCLLVIWIVFTFFPGN
jgi:hypothetical protein